MKKRAFVLFLLMIVLSLSGIAVRARRAPTRPLLALRQAQPQYPDGSIGSYAQQAQADGLAEIFVPYVVMPNDPGTFDNATSVYSVVVGQLINTYSFGDPSDYFVETWYKFRITETLSLKPQIQPTLRAIPLSLPPLGAGEIYVPRSDGAITLNGVRVGTFEAKFSGFHLNQSYLLFVDLGPANAVGTVGELWAGSSAIFAVDNVGNLSPTVVGAATTIGDGVATRFGGSLSQLRTALVSNPPPLPD